jgi:cell wall-associated NlpC family hydrolase
MRGFYLAETRRFDLAQQGNGRHRADVDINVLESFELRSRRSVREAERARQSRKSKRLAKKLAKLEAQTPQVTIDVATGLPTRSRVLAARKIKFSKRPGFRNFLTMLTASGIITTVGLPAYAYPPDIAAMARFGTTNAAAVAADSETQNLTVAEINVVKFARGKYESASAAEVLRQQTASRYLSYSGLTAADFVSNPPFSQLDEATILKVAAKYVGTPYVFGGENPAGFDCSGYVRFVFAQFGYDLPHTVIGQSRFGIKIRREDARPGDIVIMNDLSHDGIYAGNGNFYHAPRNGDTVKLAPIFTPNVFFIRLGTK